MKVLHSSTVNTGVVGLALAFLGFAQLRAQSSTDHPVGILEQHRIWAKDHFITYNRIVPPASGLIAQKSPPAPSLEDLQRFQERANKAFRSVFLGATTYDGQYSDIRWSNGNQWLRAISNIDFKYFTGFDEIETADTIYELIVMNGENSSSGIPASSPLVNWLNQARISLSQASASYIVVDGNATADPGALADLDAIHTYFNSNKDRLIQEYNQRLVEDEQRWLQQQAKPKGPKPPVIINYWPAVRLKMRPLHFNWYREAAGFPS